MSSDDDHEMAWGSPRPTEDMELAWPRADRLPITSAVDVPDTPLERRVLLAVVLIVVGVIAAAWLMG